MRLDVRGLDNIPQHGPAIFVSNHLGDADLILGFAVSPVSVYPISKIELHQIPVLSTILDGYGVIWVHRGQPDKRAVKVILQALSEGHFIAIAPEGRESLTGSLEEGTSGAAYLALKTQAPLIPVTFTGTENKRVFNNIRTFKRTDVTLTIGLPFRLEPTANRRQAIRMGTDKIMRVLANQLPPEYRGVYKADKEPL
jgi:1-acyl-sn-glycerol-3-phosphate acyltransferase